MSLLYKEFNAKQTNTFTMDLHMEELENLINCRRRGLMTNEEYVLHRSNVEEKIFDVRLKAEKKRKENSILEDKLNDIYKLLKDNSMDSKGAIKGTFRHQLTYMLEEINMALDIPFMD